MLYLNKNNISDISPLQSLSQIKILDLSNNLIEKLTPLNSLK